MVFLVWNPRYFGEPPLHTDENRMSDYDETNEILEHDDNQVPVETSATEGGSKAEKFRELAGKRVTNVLDQLRILGNLSNTGTYEYTPEQVEKIFTRIQTDLDEVKAKFEPKVKKVKDTSFEL